MPADRQQARAEVDPTLETIAQTVAEISDAVRRMRAGRLNDKALLVLISHASGESQSTVKAVLNGMEDLRAHFFKKGAT